MNRLHRLATAGVIAFAVFVCPEPASAQLVVFDPNNYAQSVLTAARALQQINNQIVSLQNQAQMLINQAKNLATLPFSSLLQLEQSIQRTQQLLAQAQRIAYDIQQIDRSFSTTYAPASSGVSDQALIANAQTRWQNAMAGLQDAMRTQATVVGNLSTSRTQMSALVTSSQGRPVRCKRLRPAISSWPYRPSNSQISQRSSRPMVARKTSSLPSMRPRKTRAGSNYGAS
jgi:P-type conjugative transfer protein TrbJ